MVTYRVGVDKDGDGYANAWSDSTDEPNLISGSADVSYPYSATGIVLEKVRNLAYGSKVHDVLLRTGATEYYDPGYSGTFDWAVSGSTTYKLSFWIWGAATYLPINLYVYSDSSGVLLSSTITIVAGWARYEYQFTTGSGDTGISLSISKPSSFSGSVRFEFAGVYMVEGTLNYPYNSGSGFANDWIEGDVERIEWERGMEKPYDPVFGLCKGEMVLKNQAGSYWPSTASWLVPGVRVVVTVDDSGTWKILGRLRVLRVEADEGDMRGGRLRVLLTDDSVKFFEAVHASDLYKTVQFDGWMFARTGASPIYGERLEESDYQGPKQAASSPVTVGYIGDRWDDGINLRDAMRNFAFITRCRVWIDRMDRIFIWEYDATDNTADATISAFDDLGYDYGGDLANLARSSFAWREPTDSDTILWESSTTADGSDGVRWWDPSESKTFIVRTRDDLDRPIGVDTLNAPAAGPGSWPTANYYFNAQADFLGTDRTANFTVTYTSLGSGVEIRATNNSGSVGAYGYFQIGGIGLLLGELNTVVATDGDSVAAYGARLAEFREFAFADGDVAQSFVDWIVANRADPREAARWIKLNQDVGWTHIVNRDLFDLVTIQESGYSGLNKLHAIISEKHDIDLGSYRHECIFGLEVWEYTS